VVEPPRVFHHVGFFCFRSCQVSMANGGPMEKPDSTVGRDIAKTASAFEQQGTGLAPKSVTVVLSGEMLPITLHAVAPMVGTERT
jgi:hypothetical protein